MSHRVRPEELFRKQVRPHVVLGAPLLRFPLSVWWVTAVALCAVALAIGAAFVVPYTKKHRVTGEVMTAGPDGAIELRVPADAVLHVSRGQRLSWYATALPRPTHGLFSAIIVDVDGPEPRRSHSGAPASYRVRLVLDEASEATQRAGAGLMPGMTVGASLPGESKPLIAWLFDAPGYGS